MKKSMSLVLVVAMMLTLVIQVFAQENTDKKLTGSFDLRFDVPIVEKGTNGGRETQTAQGLNTFLQYGPVAAYVEIAYNNTSRVMTDKAALLINPVKPLYLLGGVATNNQGSDFAQAGFWYIDSFGKFNVLVDFRNYFSTTGKSNGYTDNTLRLMHKPTDKLSIGLDSIYDRWWDSGNESYSIGPRVAYQFTKNLGVYARVLYERDIIRTPGTEGPYESFVPRAALTYSF